MEFIHLPLRAIGGPEAPAPRRLCPLSLERESLPVLTTVAYQENTKSKSNKRLPKPSPWRHLHLPSDMIDAVPSIVQGMLNKTTQDPNVAVDTPLGTRVNRYRPSKPTSM
eukprot:scaffold368349_cov53-Attheya_sp.AAC.1